MTIAEREEFKKLLKRVSWLEDRLTAAEAKLKIKAPPAPQEQAPPDPRTGIRPEVRTA